MAGVSIRALEFSVMREAVEALSRAGRAYVADCVVKVRREGFEAYSNTARGAWAAASTSGRRRGLGDPPTGSMWLVVYGAAVIPASWMGGRRSRGVIHLVLDHSALIPCGGKPPEEKEAIKRLGEELPRLDG